MFLLLLSLLGGSFIAVYLYFQHVYTFWKKHGVPHPKPEFPYGNTRDLADQKLNFGEWGAKIYDEIRKKTNSFGGFYIMNTLVYYPIGPEMVKDVLTKNFHAFQDRVLFWEIKSDPLNANLINLMGKQWKRVRGKVSHTFTSGKLRGMFQTVLACTEELEGVIEESARTGEAIDIVDIVLRLTTDNIGSCVFGVECNSLKNPEAEFRKYGKILMETTFSDTKWHIFSMVFPKVMNFFNIPFTNKKVSRFFLEFVRDTVDYREKNRVRRKDFLDLFIKLKNGEFEDDSGNLRSNEEPLSFNELTAQAFVFYSAGFETSGTTLAFCFFELAQNQDIQSKVRREVRKVLGKYQGKITYEALAEMTYMDLVVAETLRKYPPLPMINRVSNQQYTIPGTDIVLPEKTACWISILSMHRDPDIYPDPLKFDPERFTEEQKAQRHPYAYIPFGEGPRICIGMRFGLLQVKIGLTKLLNRYSFRVDEKTELPVEFSPHGIFLAPKSTLWLRATDHGRYENANESPVSSSTPLQCD